MTLRLAIRTVFSALALLLILSVANGWAQTLPVPAGANAASPPAAKIEKDPFGRETPQGMVAGLMNALAAADYERAVNFFATRFGSGRAKLECSIGGAAGTTFSGGARSRRHRHYASRTQQRSQWQRQRRARSRRRALRRHKTAERRSTAAGHARYTRRQVAVAGFRQAR